MGKFLLKVILIGCLGLGFQTNCSYAQNEQSVPLEKKFLEILPQVARDVNGKQVTSINEKTIFPNQLVKEKMLENGIKELSNQKLGDLFRTSYQEKKESLYNNFAFFIAGRLYYLQSKQKVSTEMLKELEFGSFTKEHLPLIEKHIYLMKFNKFEQTIADYIGQKGQPSLDKHKTMDLSHQNLTSLYGIDLIENADQVVKLRLNNNFILSSDLDSSFPKHPFQNFTHLEDLSLNSNQIQTLEEGVFVGLSKLRNLFIVNNKLKKLAEMVFVPVPKLEMLYLNENQLNALPENVFNNLSNLQTLLLNSNQLKTLQEKIFRGLKKIDCIGLNYNQITDLPDKIFIELPSLRSIDLSNNVMKRELEEFWNEFHFPSGSVTVYFEDFKHMTAEEALSK